MVSHQEQGGERAPLTSNNYSFTRKGPVVTEEGSRGRPLDVMPTTVSRSTGPDLTVCQVNLRAGVQNLQLLGQRKREKKRDLAGPSSVLTFKAFYNLTPGLSPNFSLGSYGGTAQPTTTKKATCFFLSLDLVNLRNLK